MSRVERVNVLLRRIEDETRMAFDEHAQLLQENARLRELLVENNEELAKMRRAIDYLYSFAKTCGVETKDVRELGVEVDK